MFHKIFLLIVKERKHSKFHQMSLKRCGLHAVVFIHIQNKRNSLPDSFHSLLKHNTA